MYFENENLKVENAESVCEIQQIIFAAHHVQFPQFALISDSLVIFSGLMGKSLLHHAF